MTVDVTVPAHELEGTVSMIETWLKSVGDPVREHEPLLEINTDKVTVEIASPATGVLSEILRRPNDEVHPGDVLGRIAVGAASAGSESAPARPADERAAASRAQVSETDSHPTEAAGDLSPAVRRLLARHGLDASEVTGSGRGGRITLEDVEARIAARTNAELGTHDEDLPHRSVPHSPTRRAIARHMVESLLRTAPHVTAVHEADLTRVLVDRDARRDAFAARGYPLTLTAYFVRATAQAVAAVPEVNSRWREHAIDIYDDCNVGIATAAAPGLVVPVVHRAQTLDLDGIAQRLHEIAGRVRGGGLTQNDVRNGTITITNHGTGGSLIATPIINQPQSAILGIGTLQKRAVVVEENGRDSIVVRPMLYVTLTIDHRVMDGEAANRYLAAFVRALEEF
jgi:2-oxoglutarate dehydrogenase E2 component (dihydrolipoamide succinyltransferase)